MWHPTIPRVLSLLLIPIGILFASAAVDDPNPHRSEIGSDSTSRSKTHRDDAPGRTPQMGWNPWNLFGCDINEKLVEEMARAMVDSGLHDLGYTYVNLDDCWQRSRNETGYIQEDPKLFPSGIASLSETVHGLGLLFGLYSDSGLLTCQRRPGGLGHEAEDAELYASWGVDYLKYDNCFASGLGRVTARYQRMHEALVAASARAGRPPFFFSLCEWGIQDPATWARTVGGNSWRTTGDIANDWGSVVSIADANDRWHEYAGPGGWNDPDMLQVGTSTRNGNGEGDNNNNGNGNGNGGGNNNGNGGGGGSGLTLSEQRAHFTLWCLMKAPLLLANDLRSIPDEIWNIISNRELIAINQDPLGVQGYKRWSALPPVDENGEGESEGEGEGESKTTTTTDDGPIEVWAGDLSGGDVAVVLFNRSGKTQTITARFSDVVDVGKFLRVGVGVGGGEGEGEGECGGRARNPCHQHPAENGSLAAVDGRRLRIGGFPEAAATTTAATAVVDTDASSLALVSISASVRDLWAHSDLGVYHDEISNAVPSHDVVALRLSNIRVLTQSTQTAAAAAKTTTTTTTATTTTTRTTEKGETQQ